MTNRQKELIQTIRPSLSDVYALASAELTHKPVGWTVAVPVMPRLAPSRIGQFLGWSSTLLILVRKAADGLLFQVQGPSRKGWTSPKWRRLLSASE